MRYNQQLINNGFDGYELAPSFGEIDWGGIIKDGITGISKIVGDVGAIADEPRRQKAIQDAIALKAASDERIAKLASETSNKKYYIIAGVVGVTLLSLGFFATRIK